MYFRYPINDAHIHAFTLEMADEVVRMADELGYEHFNMLSGSNYMPRWTANNLLCARIKQLAPGRAYAFASFNYPERGVPDSDELLRQARLFRALGFDGIKMMDGKPAMRLRTGVALDDARYDAMFDYLEETGLPVLYHVSDPWEFWHWDAMPDWAKAHGRALFYGETGNPGKEQIEREAENILKKHPRLKLIFAHWFFTSTDIARTEQLFCDYPNMSYDITPGWEMFESFQEKYDEWRPFFIEHADRILFGSDTVSDHWRETIACLRRAMETDEEFWAFEEKCKGLDLPEAPLRKIYYDNFFRYLPKQPAKLDVDGLLAYAEDLKRSVKGFKDEAEIASDIEAFAGALKN